MDTFSAMVDAREKGENIPVSIGTAQALESLCGLGDFQRPEPPVKGYDEVWVNLRTLFRNCYNALDKEAREVLGASEFLMGIQEDWLIIQGALRQATHGKIKTVLYYCSMEGFEREFPHARYKELTTDNQRREQRKEDATLKLFFEGVAEDEVRTFDVRFTGQHGKVAIITHYPSDLLWRRSFSKLDLVESHTGTIKPRSDWHTKLTGGRKLSHIPFNRLTLQVFGDGNVLFASMIPSIKKEIGELATSDNWHSLTTPDKIRHSLNKIYDPRVKEFFRSLL